MGSEKKELEGVGHQIESSSSPVPGAGLGCFSGEMNLPNLPKPLTLDEKKYLLAVERGDMANVRKILQRAHRKRNIHINCMDSLGRGALTLAIDGENLEMVELLVIMGVETKDALLQAINAEFVEAVELLLEHEELIHKEGEPYSWQKVDINTAMFTPDVTPLVLAAHRNNYEILKILLDRGATLPMPHDVKCGCDECIRQSSEDSLRHSLSRVNEYRALASPSLIALSSTDPLLTAFQLSWELRNLAFAEQECKSEYLELRRQCQKFAVDLLDQSRSSQELAIILNHDPESPPYQDGDHMKLTRLELAINYKQKKFVAHPNIQQLLAALWYEGVPGFRRKSSLAKLMIILKMAILFPFYCMLYMVAPHCSTGKFIRKPFVKFLIHASSYLFFLFLLILVSQRAEIQAIQMFGTESMRRHLEEQLLRQRGNGPTPLEILVVVYVLGFIWEETQEIFLEGIRSYLRNMWNFIDFTRNFLYCMVAFLRIIAYVQQAREIERDPSTAYIAREHWEDFDPQLIAEGAFAAANIFSALKLVHLFSINPHLGPLQISLGRMVIDIVKFFFIYSLVLFAFACGLNQLLWYFADLEKQKCYILPGGLPDWDNQADACMKWRRFGNLFESSQSLFWASFGMVGLENFELAGIKSYTRFWGLLMFGSYSVINVIVLLNLLIAMMSNSYAMIDEHSDTEWKFARTKLWMSYFEESSTLPPPFNIFPTIKIFINLCKRKKTNKELKRESTIRRKEERERDNRYTSVMRALVWRYVSAKHRKTEESPVTEDDINEVKGDISAMRYEILEVLERNGMDVSSAERKEKTVLAKRMKIWERRLMKDFQVAPINNEEDQEEFEPPPENEDALSRFRRIARQAARQTTSYKWGQVMEGVGVITGSTQIGRCRNRQSFKNQQNLQRAMAEAKRLVEKSSISRSGSPCISPVEVPDLRTNTLLELLKNISEEVEEMSPGNTLNVKGTSHNSRSVTPIAALTNQLQTLIAKSPSPMPSLRVARSPRPKSPRSERNEPCGSNMKSPPSNELKSPVPKQKVTKACCSPPYLESKTPPSQDLDKKSPPPEVRSPPPIIHVTRTESQSAKKQNDDIDDQSSRNSKEQERSPLKQREPSPPKVVKRKAPVPGTDIAVSRPIAAKPRPGQGMIPPPPSPPKLDTTEPAIDDTVIDIPRTTPEPTVIEVTRSQPSSPFLRKNEIITEPSPIASDMPKQTSQIARDPVISGSTEKLVQTLEPASEANKAACSPPCLHPVRRVEDVKTIKRQPKAGWL